MNYKNQSDENLIVAINCDDNIAFEELYNRYWAKLFSAAGKRTKSREQAEEIIQDFFAQLWINRRKLVLRTNFSVYAFTAIRYQVINLLHKETIRKNYNAEVIYSVRDYDNATEEAIYLHDLNSNIEKEISRLPEKCRIVYELSRNGLKNNKEIASQLNISEKTVENHLTKALKRLRLSLNQLFLILVIILGSKNH